VFYKCLEKKKKKKKNTTPYRTPSPGVYLYPSNTLNKLFTRVAIVIISFFSLSFPRYCLGGLIMWRALCLCAVPPPPRRETKPLARRLSMVRDPTTTIPRRGDGADYTGDRSRRHKTATRRHRPQLQPLGVVPAREWPTGGFGGGDFGDGEAGEVFIRICTRAHTPAHYNYLNTYSVSYTVSVIVRIQLPRWSSTVVVISSIYARVRYI
jgi:hypothetical protein